MCRSAALPGYTWISSSDASGFLPGWECRALEKPFSGSKLQQWFTAKKLMELIEGEWPFLP